MRALIGSSNSKCPVLFTPEQLGEKMVSQFTSVTSEESGVYYLTVLVYTKTTIHLSVSG